ncbi:MAG: hypothetical protein ACI8RZ_007708 [Myxococcota bacterium]|jgi:hypothetical protein
METSVKDAFGAYLTTPDAVLPLEGPPRPIPLAASIGAGLTGMALFVGAVGLGMLSVESGGGEVGLDLPSLMAVPPLVAVLSVPPLLLISALQGREPGLLKVIGVAASGPTITGACLGAATPLVMLYVLTGHIDGAFFLLVVGLLLMSALAGAWGALKNARRAGAASPGSLTVLMHFAFTLWTTVVLTLHLA